MSSIGDMRAWAYAVSLITYTVIGLFFGVPFMLWTLVVFSALASLTDLSVCVSKLL